MAKTQSTKRALILSMLSLLLCFSMLIGTTYAWFTDAVVSANNIIKSGTLDVELYYQVEGQTDWTKVTDTTNVFKDGALWEPGYTEVVKLKVVNEGDLALKYQLGVNVATETGSVNVYGNDFKLSDYIKYGVVEGAQSYTRDEAIGAVNASAASLSTAFGSEAVSLLPAEEAVVTMVVYMPTDVDNVANHAVDADAPVINLGINLFATQYTYEFDSFDDQYDAAALITVSNADEFKAAINEAVDGSVILLADDIDLGADRVTIKGKELTIDLNGNTIVSSNNRTLMIDLLGVDNADKRGVLTLTGNGTVKNTQNDTKNGFAVYVGGSSDLIIEEGVTVESVYGKAIIMAPMGAGRTSSLTVNGGTVIGDYAVTGYGNARDTSISIVLNSGTVYGKNVAIYQPMFGDVVINGGTVKGDGEAAIAMRSGDLAVNGGAVVGIVDILGDHHVSLGENATSDAAFNGGDLSGAALKYAVGNGNVVTKADGVAIDAPAGYVWANGTLAKATVVADAAQLNDALSAGGNVVLNNNIDTTSKLTVANGGVLDGNGNTIDFGWSFTGYEKAVNINNGKLQNITISNAGRAVGADNCTSDIYLDNVTITETQYAFNGNTTNNSNAYFTNCTIDGWISYGGAELVSFKDCDLIGETSNYYGLGYYVVYGDVEFEGCTFDNFYLGMNKGAYNNGAAGSTVTLNDCVVIVNGEEVQLTAANFKSLMMGPGDETDFGRMLNNTTIIIDGVTVS